MIGQAQDAVAVGIVRVLQNNDTVFNLVGGRIQEAEDPTTKDLTLPGIVFSFLPGRTKKFVPTYHLYNIQILVYSDKSKQECREIYEAVLDAMHTYRIAQDDSHFVIYPVQEPSDNVIEESGNFVLSSFWVAQAIDG